MTGAVAVKLSVVWVFSHLSVWPSVRLFTLSQLFTSRRRWNWWRWEGRWFKGQGHKRNWV